MGRHSFVRNKDIGLLKKAIKAKDCQHVVAGGNSH